MSTESSFFETIWGASTGRNVFLPHSRGGVWTEGYEMQPDVALQMLEMTLFNNDGVDYYFSPLRYDGKRKKGLLGYPGVIFADIDSPQAGSFRLAPSIVVQSSPQHFHGYWLLEEPVHATVWEPRAKGWSQEIGADPGGWDTTQVLRVPGTSNNKYEPPQSVWIAKLDPDCRYHIDEFPVADTGPIAEINPLPEPDRSRGSKLLAEGIASGSVPLGSVYWLTASEEDLKVLGTIDRSRVLWQQERILLEAGYTPEQVYDLLYHAGINKWKGTPLRFWKEINKAAATKGPLT
jgi:hypothetical protein